MCIWKGKSTNRERHGSLFGSEPSVVSCRLSLDPLCLRDAVGAPGQLVLLASLASCSQDLAIWLLIMVYPLGAPYAGRIATPHYILFKSVYVMLSGHCKTPMIGAKGARRNYRTCAQVVAYDVMLTNLLCTCHKNTYVDRQPAWG